MEAGVVLTFKNGVKMKTFLAGPFRPEENLVNVFLPGLAGKQSFSLDELCCIGILGSPLPGSESLFDAGPKEVEVVTGDRFRIHVGPGQVFHNGFFGIPADDSAPFERLFITSSAVRVSEPRESPQERPEYLELPRRAEVPRAAGAVRTGRDAPTEAVSRITECYQREPLNRLPYQNTRVGDILINDGLVTREQVENALATGEKKKIGALLIERGFVSEDQILAALAAKFCIPFIDLSVVTPSPAALAALSKSIVNQLKTLPIDLQGKKLIVATSEPTDSTIVDSLRFITNYQVDQVIAVSSQISAAINKYYNAPADSLDAFISDMTDEQPTVVEQQDEGVFVEPDSKVILLVNKLLIEAYNLGASDIHFEPELDLGPLSLRYRVDGECVLSHEIPAVHKSAVVSRLKIMAKLDIAERRKPQSGKIFLLYGKRKLEFRVEVTPTVEGNEDAVLRLLSSAKPLRLADMGFSAQNLSRFEEILRKPYGIILCVGPTGSGKTTTLHSALATINTPERKIWTAEDPMEIVQKGLRQVQVNAKIGFGFEEALRSFLRADPDVIMIGEMRDTSTSKTAVAASLTGHLVFSTLHTNSAPETVVRLIEIGLDPYNFADALLGVLAQRLARRLCDQCKVPYRPSLEEYQEIVANYGEKRFREHGMPAHDDRLQLMKRTGCSTCGGTGYSGRIALHELLIGSPAVKSAIKKNMPVEELRELALQEGLRTLRMDGIEKVFQGMTDLQQIMKVCIL